MEFLSISGGVQIASHVPERTMLDLVLLLEKVPFKNHEGFCQVDISHQCLGIRAEGIIDEEWGRLIEAIMLRLKPYLVHGFDITIQRPIEAFELNIRLLAWTTSVNALYEKQHRQNAA